jgi:hypothetical protein
MGPVIAGLFHALRTLPLFKHAVLGPPFRRLS